MADLWYVRTRPNGIVYKVFCDDMEQPQEGDIPLDPTWYWGQAPGIFISDFGHPEKYKVKDGRLVPQHDVTAELTRLRAQKKAEIDDYSPSPILSPGKKNRFPAAKAEAYNHVDEAINENEIIHTRIKGY